MHTSDTTIYAHNLRQKRQKNPVLSEKWTACSISLLHSAINFSNYVPYFENGKIWLVEIANFVCSRVISYWVGTS